MQLARRIAAPRTPAAAGPLAAYYAVRGESLATDVARDREDAGAEPVAWARDNYDLAALSVVSGEATMEQAVAWLALERVQAEAKESLGPIMERPPEGHAAVFGYGIAYRRCTMADAEEAWDRNISEGRFDRHLARITERTQHKVEHETDLALVQVGDAERADDWESAGQGAAAHLKAASRVLEGNRREALSASEVDRATFLGHVAEHERRFREQIRARPEELRPEIEARLAQAVARQRVAAEPLSAAVPRRDMDPRLAERLGIDLSRNLSQPEFANLLANKRADGAPIPGAHPKKNGGYDISFTGHKSFTVAFAFARGEEREAMLRAHRRAADSAAALVAERVGWARRGPNGSGEPEPGHVAWARVEHPTSRATQNAPPDPNLHSHYIIFNHVLTEGGHLGSVDYQLIRGFVEEGGRHYQAQLATELKRLGVNVAIHPKNGTACLPDVPRRVWEHFSKRTQEGEAIAKARVEGNGGDWHNMPAPARAALTNAAVKMARRGADAAEPRTADWQEQAKHLGWSYAPVTGKKAWEPLPEEQRIALAYQAGLPWLDKGFSGEAVLDGTRLRQAALVGMVASGVGADAKADVNAVVAMMREHGVSQGGKMTHLVEGPDDWWTTEKHVGNEADIVRIAKAAAADRSAALSPAALDRAAERLGIRFEGEHGRQQREFMHRLGCEGRLTVGLGVAGSGKNKALAVLVDEWRRQGRVVHGVSLAWRQADALEEAGIDDKRHRHSVTRFLLRALNDDPEGDRRFKRPPLDKNSVVVLDEAMTLGTDSLAMLLRAQERRGFQLVAVGDPLQAPSPAAGSAIDTLRRALPDMPKILLTARQKDEEEAKTVAMFRRGDAFDALARKAEDGTLCVVPGGYREAAEAAARLYMARAREIGAENVSVSAPNHEDARAVSEAIRRLRVEAGEIDRRGGKPVLATNPNGEHYTTRLEPGGKVRLFKTTYYTPDRADAARMATTREQRVAAQVEHTRYGTPLGRQEIGRNGSILDVVAVSDKAVRLRAKDGREGTVELQHLVDERSGRLLIAPGECLTIHVAQGITSEEHILAIPSGSRTLDLGLAYVGMSRHEKSAWLVASDGVERDQIRASRPVGDDREIGDAEVLDGMAARMMRRDRRTSALTLVEAAEKLAVERAAEPPGLGASDAAREAIELRRLEPAIAESLAEFERWRMSVAENKRPETTDRPRTATEARQEVLALRERQDAAAWEVLRAGAKEPPHARPDDAIDGIMAARSRLAAERRQEAPPPKTAREITETVLRERIAAVKAERPAEPVGSPAPPRI